MEFPVGAEVVVVTLGRKRGVIEEASRGRYRVRVEGVTIACRAHDLAPPPPATRRRTGTTEPSRTGAHESGPAVASPARIDLHGRTVEEAVELVTHAIDEALRRGAGRVEVVHGKGTGRVRDAVHRHLPTLGVVAEFRLDDANPGVTWVWLRD